ncbi:winged helix-turn-helix domain-containing protein [Alteromonas facilis]|uniref:winged helix-turn-helix domain-containing protein n=1 Tax=Alteromonas facilis TaxID=2048004 RepID=UPI000C284762|nr:winged helix-turn-helix domain-containing protein [Alteromonas facilis]
MAVFSSQKWTFFPDKQEIIYLDGEKKQLPSRINKCLLILISNAGKVVTYDELLKEVWGTSHKESSTISSVISEVRKLIGCGENGNKIIITVPKRGYRFSEETKVHKLDDILLQEPTNNTQTETPSLVELQPEKESVLDNMWLIKVILLGIILVAISYSAVYLVTTSKEDNNNLGAQDSISLKTYEILSHESGREDEFDVSKDGRWLTYVNKAPNITPTLKVKELASGKVQVLTAEINTYFGSPVFSDDANQIVYHKHTKQSCEVWLLDFSSKLLDKHKAEKIASCGKGGFWSTTAFSIDGNHVYYSRANALTDPYKVYRLDLRTGFERNITSPTSSGRGDYSFTLSPNGKQLAVIRNVLWQESHISINNLDNNESKMLLKLPYLIDRIGWLSDTELIYCDRDNSIWSYNLRSEKQTLLANLSFTCHYPMLSQGQVYAIKKVSINNAIWSLAIEDNGHFAINPLITSPYYDFNAMFGPDESFYFMSNRSGEKQLWQQTLKGFVQHKNVALPPDSKELEFSIETNTFYGLSGHRLFRYNLEIAETEWLSKDKHQVFNFSITDDNQLIFSEGNNEYWSLKSIDLFTLKITDLELNAFSAKQYNGELFFTRFHERGLWKKDLSSGVVEKVLDKENIKFNTFWDMWDKNTLIWASGNKFKIFDLNSGQLLSDSLTFDGHAGFVKCHDGRKMCIFSFRENEETEIIKFTDGN